MFKQFKRLKQTRVIIINNEQKLAGDIENDHKQMTKQVRSFGAHLNHPTSIPIADHSLGLHITEGMPIVCAINNSSIPLDTLVCQVPSKVFKTPHGSDRCQATMDIKERCQKCCAVHVKGCGNVSHTSTTIATQHCRGVVFRHWRDCR